MTYTGYRALRISSDNHIVTAVIDYPPMNLIGKEVVEDLHRFTEEVALDDDARVVIFKSADPDIFLTHNEFANLYRLQPDETPSTVEDVEPNGMQLICLRIQRMNKVTIAQVEGRTAGGAAVLVMACDLKFGALGKAVFNTMSVPLGTVPGGGASQFMPRLIGRSRALELILAGLDLDAATAERWGYLNRALPPEEIDAYVAYIAKRIVQAPADAVLRSRELVNSASQVALEDGLRQENYHFRHMMKSGDSIDLIRLFMEVGGETRDGEQRIEELLGQSLERWNS